VSREPIHVLHGLSIPEDELELRTSKSGGPGGQNVNKVNTRVTLRFDVFRSPSLSEPQKRRIVSRLATKITAAGILHVTSRKSRSQAANREAAEERFAALLREALTPKLARRRTAAPPSAEDERLRAKKRRSRIKRHRSVPADWQD
jgi:ribosome-associated protein